MASYWPERRYGPPMRGRIMWYVDPRYCVYFAGDALHSYIDCGNDASLQDLHAASFTVDLWLKATVKDANFILCKGRYGFTGWALDWLGPNHFEFVGMWATTGYCETTSPDYIWNNWAHLLATYNHDVDRKLYVALNGTWCSYSSQQASAGAVDSDAGQPFWIGRPDYLGDYWEGNISWVRLSGGIRYPIGINFTPPERCLPPEVDPTTIELWTLDEGSGVTAHASVNKVNDGTMTNCTWTACT